MFYLINKNLKQCNAMPSEDFVAIISPNNKTDFELVKRFIPQIPSVLTDSHFSKVEFPGDFAYVSIKIPLILAGENPGLSFVFDHNNIIFFDNNNFTFNIFDNMRKLYREKISSVGLTVYYMLDCMISNDLEQMNSLQQNLSHLEQDILNNLNPGPLREITAYRTDTMKLDHYYIQLSGICRDLCSNASVFLRDNENLLFDNLSDKIALLGSEAHQIWEYTSQIRDAYQQQLESHQNSIMKFLTIVTTIFMPLTLLTGWYGMNFRYMPELNFSYSYPLLFAISIIIVVILCVIFKKKNWW